MTNSIDASWWLVPACMRVFWAVCCMRGHACMQAGWPVVNGVRCRRFSMVSVPGCSLSIKPLLACWEAVQFNFLTLEGVYWTLLGHVDALFCTKSRPQISGLSNNLELWFFHSKLSSKSIFEFQRQIAEKQLSLFTPDLQSWPNCCECGKTPKSWKLK